MKNYLYLAFFLMLASCSTKQQLTSTDGASSTQNESQAKIVKFSLINSSDESIPLIIPSVMKPNLSPNSKSGVSLKLGQEILFRAKGKTYTLLEVKDTITPESEIDVAMLLVKRKAELGIR